MLATSTMGDGVDVVMTSTPLYPETKDRTGALATTAIIVGTVVGVVGIAALSGHIRYGDWACGFRTCVVPPGYRQRRQGRRAGRKRR